jgi:uncharacterized protein involved in exopolysaccharide biosynthesis
MNQSGRSGGDSSPAEGYAIRLYPIEEGAPLRLADLWRTVFEGRRLIIAITAAFTILAIAATFLITPQFRAEVEMAPVNPDRPTGGLSGLASQLGGLGSLAGLSLKADDTSAKSLAILRSRAFTERFIDRHGLLPVLFADLWDAKAGRWDVDDPADTPDLAKAFERFDKSVRAVAVDTQTGLVTLSIEWTDPVVARDWANALVADVNAEVRTRAIEQSKRSVEYLRGELGKTTEVELRAAIFDLMESEMKNSMLSTVRAEYAFEVIDPAVAPEKRFWPNRGLFAVVGFAAGLLLAIVAVFVRVALRHGTGVATR